MTDLPPDLLVRRANQLTTTFLDLLGILLFAAAAGYAGWTLVDPWAGLLAAASIVTVLSAVAQHRGEPRARKASTPGADEPLPGPADPGNLHVMGR